MEKSYKMRGMVFCLDFRGHHALSSNANNASADGKTKIETFLQFSPHQPICSEKLEVFNQVAVFSPSSWILFRSIITVVVVVVNEV